MPTKKEGFLIVGADDSNHAGDSKGEIIVFTFSRDYEDSIVKKFKNIRNHEMLKNWLNYPNHDYLFGILTAEKYRHSHSNLIEISSKLITAYLDYNEIYVKTLKINFDGIMDRGSRENLRKRFLGVRGIEKVIVNNFIKKYRTPEGKISKRPRCPAVVYYADVLANYLYSSKTFGELSTHEKLILIK